MFSEGSAISIQNFSNRADAVTLFKNWVSNHLGPTCEDLISGDDVPTAITSGRKTISLISNHVWIEPNMISSLLKSST